jgi:hypothetical protein
MTTRLPLAPALALASALALVATAAVAQAPSERKLQCDRGPTGNSRMFGGTAWDVYGCNDDRSVAIVTARGNPALPFYFLFVERDGKYTLSGEGTGRAEFTRKAYQDLRALSQQDIEALAKEASRSKPATQ